jgi:hypothetical protein
MVREWDLENSYALRFDITAVSTTWSLTVCSFVTKGSFEDFIKKTIIREHDSQLDQPFVEWNSSVRKGENADTRLELQFFLSFSTVTK